MFRNRRIHKVEGVEQGEYLSFWIHSGETIIVAVVEPEYYGVHSAAMSLTRAQAKKVIKAMTEMLNEE